MADPQPAERKLPEHFSVETVQHDLFRLWGGDRESKSEAIFAGMAAMFVCAAAIGHAAKRRRPLKGKKVNLFRWSQLSSALRFADPRIPGGCGIRGGRDPGGPVPCDADRSRVRSRRRRPPSTSLPGNRDRNLQTLAKLVLEFEPRAAHGASSDPWRPEERPHLSEDDVRGLVAGGDPDGGI